MCTTPAHLAARVAAVGGLIGVILLCGGQVSIVLAEEGTAAPVPKSGPPADGRPAASAAQPGTPAAAEALPAPLTADEAVRIGLQSNPQVVAARAGAAAAAATYRSQAAFPNPELGVSRVQGTSAAPTLNGTTSDTILGVTETIDTSGQRRLGAASAKAQWAAAGHQLSETEISLAQQIRDAYWSLVAARGQTQIARESVEDVQRVHALTRLQREAGASPEIDVVRSSVDVANALQASISAQGAERTALAALNSLLARPSFAPIETADSLTTTAAVPAVLPGLPEYPELLRTALANRPLVKAAEAQVQAAVYTWKQTKASRWPDVTVGYQRSAQTSVDSATLGIQLPVFDLGSIRNAVRSADEARKQAEAQRLAAQQQVTQQVAQAQTDLEQARKLVVSYQTDILAPSARVLDMVQLGYKQGATGILPVIDATSTLRNARTGYIGALLALYKAADEMMAAVGMPTQTGVPSASRSAAAGGTTDGKSR